MKIKVLSMILVFLLLFTFTGCWDYVEYEQMMKVIGVGIDYDNDSSEYTISVVSVSAMESQKGSPIPNVHSASAKTFVQALVTLQQGIQKRNFYGYVKVVILGQGVVKYKFCDIMRFFDSTPSIRSTTYLVTCPEKAEDVLATASSTSPIASGEKIFKMLEGSEVAGVSYPVTIQTFTEMLAVGGWEATMPVVTAATPPGTETKKKGGTLGGIKFDESRTGDLRLSGIAAFKAAQFIGWLGERESRGFMWLTDKNISPYKDTLLVDGANFGDIMYYRVLGSSSKTRVSMQGDMPVIDVDIKVTADIRKYYAKDTDEFITPEDIRIAQEKLSESIRLDVDAALKRAQKELKTDIFGFGFAFFRKYPRLWKDTYESKWQELYPDIPIKVSINSKIINTGANMKTIHTQ